MATSGILEPGGATAQSRTEQDPARRRPRSGYTARVLVVFLGLLNLADLLTTKAVLDRGGVEGNPLMRPLVEGMWPAALVKVALLGAVAFLVQRCPQSPRVVRGLAVVVVWYMVVVGWNLTVVSQVG